VETGYLESSARMSFIGRFRSIFTPPPSPGRRSSSGINRVGLSSNFSIQIPSRFDLRLDIAGRPNRIHPYPRDMKRHGVASGLPERHGVKYFPPNCAPSPNASDAFFSRSSNSISRKARPQLVPLRWQVVIILGRSQLHHLEVCLGRGAANHERQVVGRAGRGAERHHLIDEKRLQLTGSEQRLGLLVGDTFIGRATPLWAIQRKWYSSPSVA